MCMIKTVSYIQKDCSLFLFLSNYPLITIFLSHCPYAIAILDILSLYSSVFEVKTVCVYKKKIIIIIAQCLWVCRAMQA